MIARWREIPVTYKVPFIVALLMVAISAVLSERVLDRLSRTQESHIQGLASTYLDGLSSTVLPAVLRQDVWETFDALDRSADAYEALRPIDAVVTGTDGNVLASSDPAMIPSFQPPPEGFLDRYVGTGIQIEKSQEVGYARRDLVYQGLPVGAIHVSFDVSHLFEERREILMTLLLTNGVLALLFGVAGFLIVRQMIGPMRILEDHMRAAASGIAKPISEGLAGRTPSEARRLFEGYNALVEAERERKNLAMRLVEEEKVAGLGRLASGMAHEINNPLGGLLNAVDTLKTHGESEKVRRTSISLIERGLQGIQAVVEAMLSTYRPERQGRSLSRIDFDDIALLVAPELRRRQQRIEWSFNWAGHPELDIPSGPVRQALLNLVLNAIAASPERSEVQINIGVDTRRIHIEVIDAGEGIPADMAVILTDRNPDPILQSGRGLGLWMVRRMVDEVEGSVSISFSQEGHTTVSLELPFGREEKADAA
ncbi:HAMP domain-containing sensor histidine kinase [Aliihoeflea sp. 2WW]|uniref:sensor histidine kinase n=1 Tax=Aliihoeflea sp. 2WW TaxID=1381123 RepID=UPI000465A017|nr:HAMP domain-containing sensor histidine kinase [Aliihoeflea sp. 2WW]